jgi:hypothetical protein
MNQTAISMNISDVDFSIISNNQPIKCEKLKSAIPKLKKAKLFDLLNVPITTTVVHKCKTTKSIFTPYIIPTINETENNECIIEIKRKIDNWINNLIAGQPTRTKPGSLSYLLYGEKPSEQSINIKIGRLGEYFAKELIKSNPLLELLVCGVQTIGNKKKDVDLIFKNDVAKIIYYRELKGNIELDTEKIPATIYKCKEIESSLKITYPDYTIDCGILNWSVYNRQILTAGLSNIKSFENGGIKIDHMEGFLQIVNIVWNEDDYYLYFREIGSKITEHN